MVAYRRIRDAKMVHYVWTLPFALTIFGFVLFYLLPIQPDLLGEKGALDKASLAFTLLPGFFISALAAVSTFNRAEMDETMPAPAPTVRIHHRGNMVEIELTRRMFLSYLFSYLSVLSLLLFVVSSALPSAIDNIHYVVRRTFSYGSSEDILFYIYNIISFIFVYFCFSLIVSMLHGIYFLCERIHMPNT